MFGVKQRIEVLDLKGEIEDLKKQNEKLVYANTQYQERLASEYAQASYVLDWNAMNAFSIERQWDNGTHKTTIGYMLSEPVVFTEGAVTTKDVVREWTLYCSHAEHERLAKEFQLYIESKNHGK